MAIRGILKTFLPSGWLYGEVEDLKDQNKSLYRILKSLFTKDTPVREESFADAMVRLNLTEEYVKRTAATYHIYAILFFILGLAIFTYGFYVLFAHSTLSGWLLSMAASGLCLAQAFRFDFWSYQMRVRKLGVSFNEWLESVVGKKGPSA